MVDGKEVDHFELSIGIKQAIADGVIEAGNDLCVNYTAVLNDKADFYIIGEGKNTNTATFSAVASHKALVSVLPVYIGSSRS